MTKYKHFLLLFSYLLCLFLCLWVYLNKPNALVDQNFYIHFNYNDEFIQNNYDSRFFGVDGYLEKLRLAEKNAAIVFSKNDIYILKYAYQPRFTFLHDTNTKTTELVLRDTYEYIKLSDYNTFEEFFTKFTTTYNYNWTHTNTSTFNKKSYHTTKVYGSDYSYFYKATNDSDYYIVYSAHNDNNFKNVATYSNESLNGVGSKIQSIPAINGIKGESGNKLIIPTYYDVYGFNPPSSSKYTTLFSIDARLNASEWQNFSYNFSFQSDKELFIPTKVFDVFGMVVENNKYHWEDLNYSTDKESYCVLNYDTPSLFMYDESTRTYSVKVNIDNCVNIDKYDFIYIRTMTNGADKSYNIKTNFSHALGVYVNDIYQDGIIDEIVLNPKYTTFFSSPLDVYSGFFFYQEIEDKTSKYSRWNGVAFFDNETGKPRTDVPLTGMSFKNYKNEKFWRLDSYFGQKEKYSLYTYMYNTDSEYSKVIKYIYKPLDNNGNPNIYISTNKINDDRYGTTGTITDSNGNSVTIDTNIKFDDYDYIDENTFFDDLIYTLFRFFVPTADEFKQIIERFDNTLSKKLGGVWQLIKLPITLFSNLIDSNVGDSCLNIPSITEPFTGIKIYDGDSLCFSEFRNTLPTLFNVSDLILSIIATLGLANAYRIKFKKIIGGEKYVS